MIVIGGILEKNNLTEILVKELLSRNPSFDLAEDLPQLSGSIVFHDNDEYGFSATVCELPFDQLSYLLSLLIAMPRQNDDLVSGRERSYACKVQKCFAHLKEKSVSVSELTIQQDSDNTSKTVNSSVNLSNHVSEVLDEVGGELSSLMNKLKAKNKNNKDLEAEVERLTKILGRGKEEDL